MKKAKIIMRLKDRENLIVPFKYKSKPYIDLFGSWNDRDVCVVCKLQSAISCSSHVSLSLGVWGFVM